MLPLETEKALERLRLRGDSDGDANGDWLDSDGDANGDLDSGGDANGDWLDSDNIIWHSYINETYHTSTEQFQ